MKIIDLFAGCGGFSLGFKNENFNPIAYLDWEQSCIDTLKNNFDSGNDAEFICEDIRKSENVDSKGHRLLFSMTDNSVDGIVGGPPCQAYSMAGRIRDPERMTKDYRNYLFESYIDWLKKIQPSFFVFENVTGMLSAKPDGAPVVDLITKEFKKAGYAIPIINRDLVINLAELGGFQNRKRVIIFGLNKKKVKDSEIRINRFYDYLSKEKDLRKGRTVEEAFKGLDKLLPLKKPSKRISHEVSGNDKLHKCRFHNKRDIEIFRLLATDAERKNPVFQSVNSLKKLYNEKVGKSSSIHKYHVLRRDKPSNLIPAHLYKDGLRHIHFDPKQARSISMREAAILQNFPKTFKFETSQTDTFRMIGNAVSPLMAQKIACGVKWALEL